MAVGFLRFQSSTTGMMNFLLSDFCRSLYDQQFENWIKRNFQNSMRMYKQNKVCAISLSAVYTLDAVVFLFPVSSLTTTTVDLPADIASSGRKKRERGDDENSIPTGWRLTLLLLASFFRLPLLLRRNVPFHLPRPSVLYEEIRLRLSKRKLHHRSVKWQLVSRLGYF